MTGYGLAGPIPASNWRLATLAVLVALAAILGAWAFELIGGLVPCELCLTQRIPYYVGLPFGLAGVVLGWRPGISLPARLAFILFGLAMLTTAVIAGYHAGVEWGFWEGPTDCSGAGLGISDGLTIEELQAQLESGPRVVPCNEVQWRMFGLSLAGWNAVISLLAGLVALRAALSTERG